MTPEERETRDSRRTKRRFAVWSFRLLCACDVALLIAALAHPDSAAVVGKMEFLIATVNGAWTSIIAAYMGFSYNAQSRIGVANAAATTGASSVQTTTRPAARPANPYGQ